MGEVRPYGQRSSSGLALSDFGLWHCPTPGTLVPSCGGHTGFARTTGWLSVTGCTVYPAASTRVLCRFGSSPCCTYFCPPAAPHMYSLHQRFLQQNFACRVARAPAQWSFHPSGFSGTLRWAPMLERPGLRPRWSFHSPGVFRYLVLGSNPLERPWLRPRWSFHPPGFFRYLVLDSSVGETRAPAAVVTLSFGVDTLLQRLPGPMQCRFLWSNTSLQRPPSPTQLRH